MKKKSIGELIEKEVRKQEIPIIKFANKIGCKRNNIYNIFNRNNIDIILLKRISEVLNRNFFKDLGENLNLIIEKEETEEDVLQEKAVSQFFNVVPDVLKSLKRPMTIIFSKYDEDTNNTLPDYALTDKYITFTTGNTLKDRLGGNKLLKIQSIKNDKGYEVEICHCILYGTIYVNIKLDFKTKEQWFETLKLAYEICSKYDEETQLYI